MKLSVIEDQEEKRVDLSGHYPLEPVEIKAFLKRFSEKNKVFLSHAAVESLYEILEEGTLHRKVEQAAALSKYGDDVLQ